MRATKGVGVVVAMVAAVLLVGGCEALERRNPDNEAYERQMKQKEAERKQREANAAKEGTVPMIV